MWSMDKCCTSWLKLCDTDIPYCTFWFQVVLDFVHSENMILEECSRCFKCFFAGKRADPFWNFVFVRLCNMTWTMCKLNQGHTMSFVYFSARQTIESKKNQQTLDHTTGTRKYKYERKVIEMF